MMDTIPSDKPVDAARAESVCRREGKTRTGWLQIALAVGLFVIAGHAWSINAGLWLDDHAHFQHLREADWTLRGAVESSRLGIIGEVLDLWGRQEGGLRFFRPVAFWIMKAEYSLCGWHPVLMHIFSLMWHFACSMLVALLAMKCFGQRGWAMVAGCLMAIHPAHVATVYWIACQTELMTTAFLLLATLAYARYAGWGHPAKGKTFADSSEEHPWLLPQPTEHASQAEKNRLNKLAGFVAVGGYALALGCRENAVLFPLVCWMGDWLLGTTKQKRIRGVHFAMLGVLVGYFALRTIMLGGFPLPRRPYLMPISDAGFPHFVMDKMIVYTLGMFGALPVIPMGSRAFMDAHLIGFLAGFAAVVIILLLVWAAYRFHRSLLWPVVWMICLIAPLLPVFASSHHLYLPGVGAILLITACLAALGGILNQSAGGVPVWRRRVMSVAMGILAAGMGLACWACGFSYTRGTLAEDLLVHDVTKLGQPLHNGDHLFFINLPPLAYYAIPALRTETGLYGLKGHALTFSTDLARMTSPAEMTVLDPYRIRLRSPLHEPYFQGTTGQTILQMMGFDGIPQDGETIDAGLFTVLIRERSNQGIAELEFIFKQRLDSPEFHFYFGSPQFIAYPVDMSAYLHHLPTDQPSIHSADR